MMSMLHNVEMSMLHNVEMSMLHNVEMSVLHNVDVKVLLSEAELGLLQYPQSGPHGDANPLKTVLVHVRQFDHPDLFLFEVCGIFLEGNT